MKTLKNYAFIDGQNLYLGIQELGWKLDYKKFFIFLQEKYSVKKVYLFLGYLPRNEVIYNYLKLFGYSLVFKEILNHEGLIKGNVDAELVLQAAIEIHDYDKAIIITGDGDFACLIKYLNQHQKLLSLLTPNLKHCSALLKKAAQEKLTCIGDLRHLLEYHKK
jgi:uncharacterized LabA/DUF88 family protein